MMFNPEQKKGREVTGASFTFKRSLENPELEDVEITTPLSEDEFEKLMEIREIEKSMKLVSLAARGSSVIREFLRFRTPWGYSLDSSNTSRGEIIELLERSGEFLENNLERIEEEFPEISGKMKEMKSMIEDFVGG